MNGSKVLPFFPFAEFLAKFSKIFETFYALFLIHQQFAPVYINYPFYVQTINTVFHAFFVL